MWSVIVIIRCFQLLHRVIVAVLVIAIKCFNEHLNVCRFRAFTSGTMPEEGSVVCLYIGGCDEGDAIVINTLYKEEQKDRSNPNERYFTTKEKNVS